MDASTRGNEYRATTICVDRYESRVFQGRFYNPARPEGGAFRSLTELLLGMTDLLDELWLPQSFTRRRSFGAAPAWEGAVPPAELPRTGALATFRVRVYYRQNASWQGSVFWLEGKREEPFRSVLELVLLMDSALQVKI